VPTKGRVANVSYRGEVPASGYRGEVPKSGYRSELGAGANPDENGQEKTLCVFLLDTSGSMHENGKIDKLNGGLSQFYADILSNSSLAERVEVGLVTFDSEVKTIQEPALCDAFSIPTLTAYGATDMEGGVLKAIEIVNDRKKYYNDNAIPSKRPWIVMISDGDASVDNIKAKVKQEGNEKRYFFLPIAADDGANMDTLNSLATDKAYKLKNLKFSDFFKWLSRSIEIIVDAKKGDTVKFDDPTSFFEGYPVD